VYAPAGGVVDGVGDRGGHACDPELADRLAAQWVGVRVRLPDEADPDLRDVGVDRDHVFGKVGVDDAGVAPVDAGGFQAGRADAHDDAPDELAAVTHGSAAQAGVTDAWMTPAPEPRQSSSSACSPYRVHGYFTADSGPGKRADDKGP
jgi:hypothetical protein